MQEGVTDGDQKGMEVAKSEKLQGCPELLYDCFKLKMLLVKECKSLKSSTVDHGWRLQRGGASGALQKMKQVKVFFIFSFVEQIFKQLQHSNTGRQMKERTEETTGKGGEIKRDEGEMLNDMAAFTAPFHIQKLKTTLFHCIGGQ